MSDGKRFAANLIRRIKAIDVPIPELQPLFAATFWQRVDIRGEMECWPWIGRDHTPEGYGRCFVKPRKVIASRVAFFLTNQIDPIGFEICHQCDHPSCCNPNHLFIGTALDNRRDSWMKGRRRPAMGDRNGTRTHPESRPRGDNHWMKKYPGRIARGERQGSAKLRADQIGAIRHLAAMGCRISDIARDYGVHWTCIKMVVTHQTWKHVR